MLIRHSWHILDFLSFNISKVVANSGDFIQEEKRIEIDTNDFVYKPTTPKIVEMRVHNVLKKIQMNY